MSKVKKLKKAYEKRIPNKLKEHRKKNPMKIEDYLFVFLLVFSFFFGTSMYVVGEQIENAPSAPVHLSSKFEMKVGPMVEDYPIEKMLPYIAKEDPKVAAYLVAIAKKESNWGKYSPKKDGEDCYNYWGFRGSYNPTKSGYSCFHTPEQAVRLVGNRIEDLVEKNIDTPYEMVVWKCGSSCAGHSPHGVSKWIADVGHYYKKIHN